MKLTIKMREQIASDLMKHAFGAEKDKLTKAEGALAVKAYNEKYTNEQLAAMDVLGSTFLHTSGGMECLVEREDVPGKYDYCYLRFYDEASLVCSKGTYVKLSADLSEKVRAHLREKDKLNKLEESTFASAMGVLNSVTTVKRLVEVWPEVEAFAPKPEAATTNLPALQLDKINNILGLPPETKQ